MTDITRLDLWVERALHREADAKALRGMAARLREGFEEGTYNADFKRVADWFDAAAEEMR